MVKSNSFFVFCKNEHVQYGCVNESTSLSWNPTGIKNKSELANMTTNCFNRSIFENFFFIFISINYEIFDVFILFFFSKNIINVVVIIPISSSSSSIHHFLNWVCLMVVIKIRIFQYYCQPRKVLFVVKSIPSDYWS